MREVSFTKEVRVSGNSGSSVEQLTINGYFHTWGVDWEEFEQGIGMHTVGIIEDTEGYMHTAPPNRIMFKDKKRG